VIPAFAAGGATEMVDYPTRPLVQGAEPHRAEIHFQSPSSISSKQIDRVKMLAEPVHPEVHPG